MKTLTEQEKQIETIKAVAAITEFIKHEIDYNTMMEEAALGQCEILNMLNEVNPINHSTTNITNFVWNAINVMKLLKPFAKMEGQVI